MTLRLRKYYCRLKNLPPAGVGKGYHPALLGVANLGCLAGLDDGTIFRDIRKHTKQDGRSVPDSEICDTLTTARNDGGDKRSRMRSKAKKSKSILPHTTCDYRNRLIQAGRKYSEENLKRRSALPIAENPLDSGLCLLDAFYANQEYLFIGPLYFSAVSQMSMFKDHLKQQSDASLLPLIIPNPLTGKEHLTKKGTPSKRCDNAIAEFRFAIAEFDEIPKPDQIAFWSAIPLPIAALIDSGGKSIHAWIRLSGINTSEDWQVMVKETLYLQLLVPMGIDPACSNPSRLSRFPGHFRSENGAWQRLLYINPQPSPNGIFGD